MQVKKQHLGLDMKQWTDSKLGKESTKALNQSTGLSESKSDEGLYVCSGFVLKFAVQ